MKIPLKIDLIPNEEKFNITEINLSNKDSANSNWNTSEIFDNLEDEQEEIINPIDQVNKRSSSYNAPILKEVSSL